MPSDHEACLAAGMNDVLTKPLDRALLAERLKRYLGRPEPL
jgi:CheY-like chemotaxis protein